MKKSLIVVFILLASFVSMVGSASAQALPYLGNAGSGNYTYTDLGGTGSLTFTGNFADWVTYTNGAAYDDLYFTDDISYMSEFVFGPLVNSSGDLTNFGSSTLTVRNKNVSTDVYFTATIDKFDTSLTWMNLSNVTAGNLSSRYVDEMLAVGNGTGNLQLLTLTPGVGGTEDFIGNSSGSSSFIIAAPEPISAVLFITGGVTLALRRFRRKRI